ncbi:DUF1566 domain-containing protein [Rhodoferax antarcticus]|uniref:DUF1566 domain-containing protein n=1 Tax=Rhodoferax antarcticus TaxID=81479 RepID=UPI0022245E75|nr:DUF1566 domain-containing protein [Rhodoferax antarcticus]MCW2311312.1 hypothetical protein [Rhodoferax antarcticus]
MGQAAASDQHIGLETRFIDHEDGTVSDTRTGLMWMRPAIGQHWEHGSCTGIAKKISMREARAFQMEFAGYDDWRLPTIDELQKLIETHRLTSRLDIYAFPNQTAGNYLSSKLSNSLTNQKMLMISSGELGYGEVGYGPLERGAGYLRLVRRNSAMFVPISITLIGTGSGIVTRSPEKDSYLMGRVVTLTAHHSGGSKFKCWHGAATGLKPTCTVTMDSAKAISAEFIQLEFFGLELSTIGSGKGVITENPKAEKYVDGSIVTLTAKASNGSKFNRWGGAPSSGGATCTVTMDAAKTVTAEFIQLESFALDLSATGTGSGRVKRSVDTPTYFSGSTIILTAQADEGSIFNGWHGDASGLDDSCTVTMNSAQAVSAEFEKVTISDTVITVEIEKVELDHQRRGGKHSYTFHLTIHNKGQEQVRIKVPLTSYVSQSGQASEQNGWHSESVNGSKGVTLTAGAFCRMGLVYFQPGLNKGGRLHVNVVQQKPFPGICFTFKCIDANHTFVLVNASSEGNNQTADVIQTLPAMTKLLKRIESLEDSLTEVLRRLDGLQNSFPRPTSNLTSHQTEPAQTLPEVLAWLATQDRIAVAELRVRLLPLDLLPGAVINEINERALDLIGELALAETGDEIVVVKEILDEVLADWDSNQTSL